MIKYAPYLSGTPLRRLEQAQAYLNHLCVSESSYLVSPDPDVDGGDNVRIIYTDAIYGGRAPACAVSIANRSGWIVFQTHLYDAVRLLVMLHYDCDWMAHVRDLDTSLAHDRVCEYLRLDFRDFVRSKVSTSGIGNYVAPQDDIFISFSVDVHGEFTQEADAASLNSLCVAYALIKDYTDRNVGAQFAQFAVL